MPATYEDRIRGLTTSVAKKAPCEVATTANITLSGLQTIDGVTTVAGTRVLVKSQTDSAENGIWNASASAWTRALDFDGSRDAVDGTQVYVSGGSTQVGDYTLSASVYEIEIGTTEITFARNVSPDDIADIQAVLYDVNVATYLPDAANDRAAFEAAIAAIPTGAKGTIRVPYIGRDYSVSGSYFDLGDRHITWNVEPNIVINSSGEGWQKLHGPLITPTTVQMEGFANKSDNTAFGVYCGGATQLVNQEPNISSYDTIQEQAWQGERGRCGVFVEVTSAGQVMVDGVGINSHTEISVPAGAALSQNQLRVGMFIDAPGSVWNSVGNDKRYTTRVTGWSLTGSVVTTITIAGWYRSNATGSAAGTDAVQELPSVDRGANTGRIWINPANKIWAQVIDLWLQRPQTDFEETSGSFLECHVYNNTGAPILEDYNQDTRPTHFWGIDLTVDGDYGGGTAVMTRGLGWDYAFRSKAATIGFYHEGTTVNDDTMGFVCDNEEGSVGAAHAFMSRTKVSGVFDNNATISGKAPIITLGRGGASSSPMLKFRSSGFYLGDTTNNDYDVRVFASGGTNGALAQGTLTINADILKLDATAEIQVGSSRVIGPRETGWSVATGTATRTAFDTATVTTAQLAERVKALIDDLHATAGHGLIGT